LAGPWQKAVSEVKHSKRSRISPSFIAKSIPEEVIPKERLMDCLSFPSGSATVDMMSSKAQAILDEIRALPPRELQAIWRELQLLSNAPTKTPAPDPIRSARGMLAGGRLGEALLASRAEERHRG
jgi:hypothetical protein